MSRTPSRLESPEKIRLLVIVALAACGGDTPGPGSAVDTAAGPPPDAAEPIWVEGPVQAILEPVDAGVEVVVQAVSPVSDSVVWMSGHEGTWLRSEDGGRSWRSGTIAGHEQLQFRDVHAFDARTAVLMSAGEGSDSRLFRTTDGGESWTETFAVTEPDGFLDCMAFWEDGTGLVYGDAVDGELYLLRSPDGGRTWARIPPGELPKALEGEGGFAASGSCLRTGPDGRAWIGTGNGARPRLLATSDGGRTWEVRDVPLAAGVWQGATSVGIRPDGLGFMVGGNVGGEPGGARVALTADGGTTWSNAGEPELEGPLYGAAWVPARNPATIFAVGPGGMGWSRSGGLAWENLATTGPYWAVEFASPFLGWAVGSGGLVTRIRMEP